VDYDSLVTIQGYAKFFFILFLTIVFYSYAYTIYKRQKTGEKDYEKYSNLVLDDSINSQPLENRKNDNIPQEIRGQKLEKGER
jgi:cytochrome c oxidase cbb3-type subunit 4